MDSVRNTGPAPACNLTPRDVAGVLDHRAAEHAARGGAFARSDQSSWAETDRHGLLSACARTSIDPLAVHLGGPIRPLPHFIGQSTWSIAPIVAQHQRLVAATLAEDDGVFVVDECGLGKQGHDRGGGAPQYCGSVGKVANSQVGVYLGYASRKGYPLLAGRRFLPARLVWRGVRRQTEGDPAADDARVSNKT